MKALRLPLRIHWTSCVAGLLSVVLAQAAALATDITTCGTTIARGDTGVIQVDLTCQPGGFQGVTLDDGAALNLNGHRVATSIHCLGKCTIAGPGVIGPGEFSGVVADAYFRPGHRLRLRLRDLTIDHTEIAVDGNEGGRPSLRATNVVVTNSRFYGFYAPFVRAENITATGNLIGVYARSLRAVNVVASNNRSYGVYALGRMTAQGLTATNNGDAGVRSDGNVLRLIDSTVTGNAAAGNGIDIESARLPVLQNTVCGRSEMTQPPLGTWKVCTND